MARTPKIVEDRREQIIDAAMRVFAQKGFNKATNKDIAQEAGITPGLIYHYFENKEAVLRAIIENRSPLRILNTTPPQAFALPPEVFFRSLILQVLRVVEGEQFVQLMRVVLPEIVYDPEMSSVMTAVMHRVLGFLGGYLKSKMETGELRYVDPAFAPQILLGSIMTFVLRRQIIHDPQALQYTHEQIADFVIDTVLNGLLPRS